MQQHHLGTLSITLIHWVISSISVLLTSKIVPGFKIKGLFSALMAALIIGFANAFIWPILFFLTLPITIITLGLFTFVINAAVLKISAAILPGFEISGWWSAFFGWLVLSLSSYYLHYIFI